ncbi:hypothetical protein CEUSTIGMA_g5634.t1 [Chlamydomonas eustigma]|uniref:Uncharacterized protein n=1 Tax=Chlamydomonas eustigma TaxID=1157962 RepID=A0A250X5M1_9CHLO|nr:hypothetical protein CEUSTIGMA_g5634.t1 [Chlamydomonas eustigma]|eukprot:GAX78192.1 hypothetical protein CEUSTIGMA_g5634.t1 [Chlamydomonas eustigma]
MDSTQTSKSRKVIHGYSLTKSAPDYKPVSSIPAKFETVLFKGPREKKGFGSVSKRFGESDADNPGPGEYVEHGSMEYKHDSISKKGYGSMVSNDKRWRGRRNVYTGPGPGDFEQRTPIELNKDKYFNKAPVTSVFHKQDTRSLRPPDHPETVPGPGAYVSEDTTRTGRSLHWDSNSHTHVSAFKAAPHKLNLLGNVDAPPPTKYTLADQWDPKSSANKVASRTPSHAGLSSFAGRSVSSTMGPHDPTIYLVDPMAASKKPDTGPGPGSYELQYFEGIKTRLEKGAGKTSSSFQQREYTDRFGRPLLPAQVEATGSAMQKPGFMMTVPPAVPPNTSPQVGRQRRMDPVTRIGSPGRGVISPFRSRVSGHADFDLKAATRAPGPAFYSPEAAPRKTSHHLNARKIMVNVA